MFTGPAATGLPFTRARRLIGVGSALWAATDAASPLQLRRPHQLHPLRRGRRAPRSPHHDPGVAPRGNRCGTARGMARFVDSTGAEALAPDYAGSVGAVAIGADTVWVGTPHGRAVRSAIGRALSGQFGRGNGCIRAPDLRFRLDGGHAGRGHERPVRLEGAGNGRWTLGAPISGVLGPLRRLVADGDGFWVAGDLGGRVDPAGWHPVRPLLVEATCPARRSIWRWMQSISGSATTAGLVRFRLREVRP